MTFSDAAGEATDPADTQRVSHNKGNVLTRRIWLPTLIYAALPFFYILAGVVALLATLYISEWFWILPHYLLFSAACIHLGILIYRRRMHH